MYHETLMSMVGVSLVDYVSRNPYVYSGSESCALCHQTLMSIVGVSLVHYVTKPLCL